MRKTQLRITKVKVKRGKKRQKYYCVIAPKLGGGRTRKFFEFTPEGKKEAETKLELLKTQKENYGTAALTLSPAQREEYIECCETLEPFKLSVREAIRMLLPQLKALNQTCTVKELIEKLLKAKKADGKSARYLGDLQHRLKQFAEVFGERTVASIAGAEVDAWLRTLPVSAVSRNNSRRVLSVAFAFALDGGYCTSNPAKASKKAKEIGAAPGILTPTELARLLEASAPALLPLVAIGAFAGLRTAELERLDWKEVDLQSGLIEVTAKKAKGARRRLVKIQANLAEWLTPHAKQEGTVAPVNCRKLLEAARRTVGFGTPGTETDDEKKHGIELKPWPDNALRHSFASYHMANFKNAAELSLEMGHKDANIVFNHYRELVKPKDAKTYSNITPANAENIIRLAA